MDENLKHQLLGQFENYLDTAPDGPQTAIADDEFSLVAEVAGMKSEVKRSTRQIKEMLDRYQAAMSTLQTAYESLTSAAEQQQEQQNRQQSLRPLLLQLLELYDRLEAGTKLKFEPRRSWFVRWHSDHEWRQRLEALQEGQQMSLRRLTRILAEQQLRPLEAIGKTFDPHTMKAVEVEIRTDLTRGTVTGELRKGFFWGDELLRPAEVKVADETERKETL